MIDDWPRKIVNHKSSIINLRNDPFGFQVGLKRLWNRQAAIGLLIRLHQRDKQSCQSRAAAVENMRKSVFARFRFEPQIHPARLEIFAI